MKKLTLCLLLIVPVGCTDRGNSGKIKADSVMPDVASLPALPPKDAIQGESGGSENQNALLIRLVDEAISDRERDRIVQEIVKNKPLELALGILILMREYCSPLESGYGEKPWTQDGLSVKARIWYASSHIWDDLFDGSYTPDKVRMLLTLLETHNDSHSRCVVLKKLGGSQWTTSAERPVLGLGADPKNDIDARNCAFTTLLQRTGHKYAHEAIEYVKSLPVGEQGVIYCRVFNIGNRFVVWPADRQEEVIRLGFATLKKTTAKNADQGYFLARQLGFFLRIPNEFSPDQRDPAYKTEHALNDKFFSQTVENALEWEKSNLGIR